MEETAVNVKRLRMEDKHGNVDDPQAREHEHSEVEGRVAERRAAVRLGVHALACL